MSSSPSQDSSAPNAAEELDTHQPVTKEMILKRENIVEAFDEKSNKVYYYNSQTNETMWELPEKIKEQLQQLGLTNILYRIDSIHKKISEEEQKLQSDNTVGLIGVILQKLVFFVTDFFLKNVVSSPGAPPTLITITRTTETTTIKASVSSTDNIPVTESVPVSPTQLKATPLHASGSIDSELNNQGAAQRIKDTSNTNPRRRTVTLSAPVSSSNVAIIPQINGDGTNTLVKYAASHFQKIRKGIFKKAVSIDKLTSFTSKSVKTSLHFFKNSQHSQKSAEIFDWIQQYMGDRKSKESPQQLAKEILEAALAHVPIRNEITVQLLRQCNKNPKEQSTLKGIQLLNLYISCFPPTSFELQDAVLHFLLELQKKYPVLSPHFEFAKMAEKRLRRMVVTGPRKTLPSDKEIANAGELSTQVPIFGVTIGEYFTWQQEVFGLQEDADAADANSGSYEDESFLNGGDGSSEDKNRIIKPRILEILVQKLENMDGLSIEGIFRKPGDTKEVERLKDQIQSGNLTNIQTNDVHALASLFKLWLRELAEPIIPYSMYDTCIASAKDKTNCMKLAQDLPIYNRSILFYVCQFLQKMCNPELSKKTKMTIENLAVVFSPNIIRCQSNDPMTIMKNSNNEQNFVKNIINSLAAQ